MSPAGIADSARAHISYQLPIWRLFWLPIGVSGTLVLAVLIALVVVAWLGLMRVEPVQANLNDLGMLGDLGLNMEQVLLNGMHGKDQIDATDITTLSASLDTAIGRGGYLNSKTPERLGAIAALLSDAGSDRVDTLSRALAELRAVLSGEREDLDRLMDKVARDTRAELDLAVVLLLILPLLGGLALLMLRTRVQRPLAGLGELLARLAENNYRPVNEEVLRGSAAIVQPVFRSYNELVHRLRSLEAEHRDREHTLEQEVRRATGALLTQSRQLARSERLAAVGAVAAGLAHELRNPLAGIQMACAKLQRALVDSDQSARLEAVVGELKRLNRLLSERVDAARHAPESLRSVNLKHTVDEFLSLARYQVPMSVRLVSSLPPDLVCRLPEGGLRQALLNLVLNAAQCMEGDEGEVVIDARRQGEAVVLSVSDTGPGFPPGMLSIGVRAFASGRLGGTGLGLAMVRRFTEDVNGGLELSNRVPRGARVTLRMPCLRPAPDGGDRGAADA